MIVVESDADLQTNSIFNPFKIIASLLICCSAEFCFLSDCSHREQEASLAELDFCFFPQPTLTDGLNFRVEPFTHLGPFWPIWSPDSGPIWIIPWTNGRFCVTQLKLYTVDKLSSSIFCCLSVRHRWHLTKYRLFPIYTGIQALCWPCTT